MVNAKIRIGIISPSEIALRRFMPALIQLSEFEYVGVAYANSNEWSGADNKIIEQEKEKANQFLIKYGGKLYDSYKSLIDDKSIDAVYLPLPPALHFIWAKEAMQAGKHVLIEKPATTKSNDTNELINLAKSKNLALHENYMFVYHKQIDGINEILNSGKIGDLRLIQLSFGFPRRSMKDFRYNKQLGGGALLDCGGYTIKYASMLLGDTTKIRYAISNYINEFDVDLYGSAALSNDTGLTVQVAFGMDNSYKCDLEVWGSKGALSTGRIFTAPVGFEPEAIIKLNNQIETIKLPSDDTFKKSIQTFYNCIKNDFEREGAFKSIQKQALLIEEFIKKSNLK